MAKNNYAEKKSSGGQKTERASRPADKNKDAKKSLPAFQKKKNSRRTNKNEIDEEIKLAIDSLSAGKKKNNDSPKSGRDALTKAGTEKKKTAAKTSRK